MAIPSPTAPLASTTGLHGAMSGINTEEQKSTDSVINLNSNGKPIFIRARDLPINVVRESPSNTEGTIKKAGLNGSIGTTVQRISLSSFPRSWKDHQPYFAAPGKAELRIPDSLAQNENLIWELEAPSTIPHQGFYFAISGIPKFRPNEYAKDIKSFCDTYYLDISIDTISDTLSQGGMYALESCDSATYFFPVPPMLSIQSGEPISPNSTHSNPDGHPHYAAPFFAMHQLKKRKRKFLFGQFVQVNAEALRSALRLGIIRGIPTDTAGCRWALSSITPWLSERAGHELLTLMIPYSPKALGPNKLSGNFDYLEPMMLVFGPPSPDATLWENLFKEALYGAASFTPRIIWINSFPVQVLSGDEFAEPTKLILPDPILAHRVATITIQVPDTVSFHDVIACLVEQLPDTELDALTGAVYLPRTRADNVPEVWAVFHPKYVNPSFRQEGFSTLGENINFTIRPIARPYLQQLNALRHLKIGSAGFDSQLLNWKHGRMERTIEDLNRRFPPPDKSFMLPMVNGDLSFLRPASRRYEQGGGGNGNRRGPLANRQGPQLGPAPSNQSKEGWEPAKGARSAGGGSHFPSTGASGYGRFSSLAESDAGSVDSRGEQGGVGPTVSAPQQPPRPATTGEHSREVSQLRSQFEELSAQLGRELRLVNESLSSLEARTKTLEQDKAQQQHQTTTMSGRISSTETDIAALKSETSNRLDGLEGTIQQATTSIEEICSAMVQRVEESALSGIRQLEDSISSLRSSVSSLTSNTNPSHESILAPALDRMREILSPVKWAESMCESLLDTKMHTPLALAQNPNLLELMFAQYHKLPEDLLGQVPQLEWIRVSAERGTTILTSILSSYHIPMRTLGEFTQGVNDENVRQYIVSTPATLVRSLDAWVDENNAAPTEEEFQAGVLQLVTELLPEPAGTLPAFAACVIRKLQLQTRLTFAPAIRAAFDQLNSVDTWREATKLQRETELQLRQRMRTALGEALQRQSLTEHQTLEFISNVCSGPQGISMMNRLLTDPGYLTTTLEQYQELHKGTRESAFGREPLEDPHPYAFPFWVCGGGCFTPINSKTAILCMDCDRGFCDHSDCTSQHGDSFLCHVCVQMRGLNPPSHEAHLRTFNFAKGTARTIWMMLVRAGLTDTETIGQRVRQYLACGPTELGAALERGVLPELPGVVATPGQPGKSRIDRSPSEESSRQRARQSSPAATAGTSAETSQSSRMVEDTEDVCPDPGDGELTSMKQLQYRLEHELAREDYSELMELTDALNVDCENTPSHVLLVGFRPYNSATFHNINASTFNTTDAADSLLQLALKELWPGVTLWTWHPQGEGPQHVTAAIRSVGAGQVRALLNGRRLDTVMFHFSHHRLQDMATFLGTSTDNADNALKTLVRLGTFSPTVSILLPHYTQEHLSHLTGSWTTLQLGAHPLDLAQDTLNRFQGLISKKRLSRTKLNFTGWLNYTPGAGRAPPKPPSRAEASGSSPQGKGRSTGHQPVAHKSAGSSAATEPNPTVLTQDYPGLAHALSRKPPSDTRGPHKSSGSANPKPRDNQVKSTMTDLGASIGGGRDQRPQKSQHTPPGTSGSQQRSHGSRTPQSGQGGAAPLAGSSSPTSHGER